MLLVMMIDPMTLCPTRYFITRDSLGKRKIHYKITESNLLEHMNGIYHISKIHSEIGRTRQGVKPANAIR